MAEQLTATAGGGSLTVTLTGAWELREHHKTQLNI